MSEQKIKWISCKQHMSRFSLIMFVATIALVTTTFLINLVNAEEKSFVGNIQDSAFNVQIDANPPIVYLEDVVEFSYSITNETNIEIPNITLEDNLGLINNESLFALSPGETRSFMRNGQFITDTTVTLTATSPISQGQQATAETFVQVVDPSLQLHKSVSSALVPSDTTVTYTFNVTNTGNITLNAITIIDPLVENISPISLSSLEPQNSSQFTATYNITDNVTNIATATANAQTEWWTKAVASEPHSVTVNVQGSKTSFLPLVQSANVWEQIGDFPEDVKKFYDVAACKTNGETRYIAGTDDGVYSLNQDEEWKRRIVAGVVLRVSFVPNFDCNRAYAAVRDQGIYYLEYDGSAWAPELIPSVDGEQNRAIVVRSKPNADYDVFIGGTYGLLWANKPVSENTNWQNTNLTNQVLLTGLTINDNEILAATWEDNIYSNNTPDNNHIWSDNGSPTENRLYEVAKNDAGQLVAGTQVGTYYFDDEWKQAAQVPQNPSLAAAATENALYSGQLNNTPVLSSIDGGKNWVELKTGMKIDGTKFGEFQVWSITVELDGSLYAATTSGIWRWTGTP